MPKIIRNEIEYSSTTSTANQISYLNTTSGLSATNVQDAVDEVVDSRTYKRGDVINIGNITVVGWVTGGRQNIRFTLALSKPLPDTFTITPSGKARMYSTEGFNMFPSGTNLTDMGTFTFAKVEGGVSVLITFASAFSASDVTNNAPTLMYLESTARLTLS